MKVKLVNDGYGQKKKKNVIRKVSNEIVVEKKVRKVIIKKKQSKINGKSHLIKRSKIVTIKRTQGIKDKMWIHDKTY